MNACDLEGVWCSDRQQQAGVTDLAARVCRLEPGVSVAGFGLCGKIVATEGNGDVLAGYLLDAASALEDVEACRLYAVSRDPGEPEAVWVVEFWDSAEAHRASLELSAVQQLISRARPIIAAMGERFEFEPVGGKGLEHP